MVTYAKFREEMIACKSLPLQGSAVRNMKRRLLTETNCRGLGSHAFQEQDPCVDYTHGLQAQNWCLPRGDVLLYAPDRVIHSPKPSRVKNRKKRPASDSRSWG